MRSVENFIAIQIEVLFTTVRLWSKFFSISFSILCAKFVKWEKKGNSIEKNDYFATSEKNNWNNSKNENYRVLKNNSDQRNKGNKFDGLICEQMKIKNISEKILSKCKTGIVRFRLVFVYSIEISYWEKNTTLNFEFASLQKLFFFLSSNTFRVSIMRSEA